MELCVWPCGVTEFNGLGCPFFFFLNEKLAYRVKPGLD